MVPSRVMMGGEIPPARTPFKIQDPYTGRYVWNKDDNLHLRGNGDGEELLWELEYTAVTTAVETGYLLRNVHSGKVMVDESAGDGRLQSRGFGVKEVAINGEGGELDSQVWTMRPLECDVRRGLGRLYCIQNRRNRAYIVNGLRARGKKQLRTSSRVTKEESKSQAWRFILMSEPPTVSSRSPDSTGFESPSTSSSTRPERISSTRPNSKRSRSDRYRDRGSMHEESEYWKCIPPPIPIEDFGIDERVSRKVQKHLPGRSSSTCTAGDSNFLQESIDGSWMSQPSWKRWISAVSDFDVSRVASNIGTRKSLENGSYPLGDVNELLADSPWYSLAKLEETAP